jgi:DNA-binding transcriptional MerR regulator
MAEDLCDFLQKQGISIDAIKRVIINYKKLSKANVTLTKTRSRLADLQKYWEKLQSFHARIRRAATAEDRKKLPYFLQDEFLAAKDAYNRAADYLQEAIANFVMPEISIYDLNTDSVANFVMPDSSICDLSTDSALRDFAGTLATIIDNSRNESRSLANRIPVPKCIYCTGSHGLEDCEKFLLSSVE